MKVQIGIGSMDMKEIAALCGGQLVGTGSAASVCTDSREATDARTQFAVMVGERVDAHTYMRRAYDNGCRLFLCQRIPEEMAGCDFGAVVVPDTVAALGALAATMNASAGTVVSGYFMTNFQVYAFLAGILGGFGTFYGPVLAALMIPLANNLVQYFVNVIGKPELTGWSMVIVYAIALVIIFFKPQGIFGKKIARKV